MSAGTGRCGEIAPGRTGSKLALWQRLNLRPLPQKHWSFAFIVAVTAPRLLPHPPPA